MKYSDFEIQWDRLKSVYAPSAANDERKKLFWERFKNDDAAIFEKAINSVILELTTQAFPAMSRIAEAAGIFRNSVSGASMQHLEPSYACEKCRDFGFSFDVDTLVRCKCNLGPYLDSERLAKMQKSYDIGCRLFPRPGQNGAARPSFSKANLGTPLPYDPNERITDRSDEWS